MHIIARCLSFCLAALIAGGCSSEPESSDTSSSRIGLEGLPPNPVFVVSGGFNSCARDADGVLTPEGMGSWVRAAPISTRFAQGEELWVRSCFDAVGGLYFVSSQSPWSVQYATTSDPAPYFETVKVMAENGNHPVYILGHSHGGWLAMYLAYWLNGTVPVRRLFTVDPISPQHCTPASFAAAILSPGSSPIALAGCQRAPSDFEPAHRAAILRNLPERGAWVHYYQRNFIPLRSSSYDDGVVGTQYDVSPFLSVSAGGARASWNAHAAIDDLSTVWYTFEAGAGFDLGSRE